LKKFRKFRGRHRCECCSVPLYSVYYIYRAKGSEEFTRAQTNSNNWSSTLPTDLTTERGSYAYMHTHTNAWIYIHHSCRKSRELEFFVVEKQEYWQTFTITLPYPYNYHYNTVSLPPSLISRDALWSHV